MKKMILLVATLLIAAGGLRQAGMLKVKTH